MREPHIEREMWPLSPSHLGNDDFARYRRGMSPSACLEDRIFYLSCRFDGHQMLLARAQQDAFRLIGRNRRNVLRAWRSRCVTEETK